VRRPNWLCLGHAPACDQAHWYSACFSKQAEVTLYSPAREGLGSKLRECLSASFLSHKVEIALIGILITSDFFVPQGL